MAKIDWTKPVRGKVTLREVTLLHDAFEVRYPNGSIQFVRESELENVPEPRFAWINVYDGSTSASHNSRKDADYLALGKRVHVLKLNLDTGETVKEPA